MAPTPRPRAVPSPDAPAPAGTASDAPASAVTAPDGTATAWPPDAAAQLADLVAAALAEDLEHPGTGPAADATVRATVADTAHSRAEVRARERGVVAGIDALGLVWAALDERVVVRVHVADGDTVGPGAVLATVEGPAAAVFTGERTALNLLGHLSGVATATAAYVAAVGGRCAVRDTRKTLPGMRAVQKRAVVLGGGRNHRFGLSDGILVKDNHVAAAGGIAAATGRALADPAGVPVQIEVDDLDELDTALELGATAVLLDNFDLDALREGVRRCRARGGIFVEASGGIDLSTVAAIAATGVDAVAVGALTHSARVLDVGLDVHLDAPTGDAAPGSGGPARTGTRS